QRYVLDRIDLEANARSGQRIGRAAARQVRRGDGRPVALQEHGAEFAEEELGVGGNLAGLDARLATGELLLEPYLRQPRGRHRFDRGDGVEASDIVAPDAAGVVNLEKVGEERKTAQARELVQVDGQDAL